MSLWRRSLARSARVAPANFSQDTRGPARAACAVSFALALAAGLSAVVLVADAARLERLVGEAEAREARLLQQVAAVRQAAREAPAADVFTALRARIAALNELDYGNTPAVGGLLDTLEETLPDEAVFTNIDYDRARGQADLVAIGSQSDGLTKLFNSLDGHALISKARLLDKKQVAAAGATQTQVHLILEVGPRKPPSETDAAKAGAR